MAFRAVPRQLPAGREVTLEMRVLDPKSGKPVTQFEIVHEKLFHLFLVSQDLDYFSHEHPVLGADGWFRLNTTLPKAGTYRLLADFDPSRRLTAIWRRRPFPPPGTWHRWSSRFHLRPPILPPSRAPICT